MIMGEIKVFVIHRDVRKGNKKNLKRGWSEEIP